MTLRKPPLRDVHDAAGATFTEFGGWDMPVEFDSIKAEHRAVREDAGIFDVSHMGQIEVSGPDAEELMQRLTSNDVTELGRGDSHYSMILDEEGTILDDTVVYRLPETDDAEYLFVPNAGHDEQMHRRWTDHRDEWDLDATVENVTDEYAMFAVQGPTPRTERSSSRTASSDRSAKYARDHPFSSNALATAWTYSLFAAESPTFWSRWGSVARIVSGVTSN